MPQTVACKAHRTVGHLKLPFQPEAEPVAELGIVLHPLGRILDRHFHRPGSARSVLRDAPALVVKHGFLELRDILVGGVVLNAPVGLDGNPRHIPAEAGDHPSEPRPGRKRRRRAVIRLHTLDGSNVNEALAAHSYVKHSHVFTSQV